MSQELNEFGFERLSNSERLELIGLIWDSITELPIPDEHLRELERRRAAAEADPDVGVPWEVVKARLMGQQ
jgi:putative addiction module component (TIGR02574 family)